MPSEPQTIETLESELGKFESEMDDEAGKVFEKMQAVRARAPEVFKRTHARVDAKAKAVDRMDALLTSLDRSNSRPTAPVSPNGSGNSSATAADLIVPPATSTTDTKPDAAPVVTAPAAADDPAQKKT